MGDTYPVVRVATVEAASVFLGREASAAKAGALIKEAVSSGAIMIAFPECFIPRHPVCYHYHTDTGAVANELAVGSTGRGPLDLKTGLGRKTRNVHGQGQAIGQWLAQGEKWAFDIVPVERSAARFVPGYAVKHILPLAAMTGWGGFVPKLPSHHQEE